MQLEAPALPWGLHWAKPQCAASPVSRGSADALHCDRGVGGGGGAGAVTMQDSPDSCDSTAALVHWLAVGMPSAGAMATLGAASPGSPRSAAPGRTAASGRVKRMRVAAGPDLGQAVPDAYGAAPWPPSGGACSRGWRAKPEQQGAAWSVLAGRSTDPDTPGNNLSLSCSGCCCCSSSSTTCTSTSSGSGSACSSALGAAEPALEMRWRAATAQRPGMELLRNAVAVQPRLQGQPQQPPRVGIWHWPGQHSSPMQPGVGPPCRWPAAGVFECALQPQPQQPQPPPLCTVHLPAPLPPVGALLDDALPWAGGVLGVQCWDVYLLCRHVWARVAGRIDDLLVASLGASVPPLHAAVLCGLWLASKLEGGRRDVAPSSWLAAATGLSGWGVTAVELHLLQLLDYAPYSGY